MRPAGRRRRGPGASSRWRRRWWWWARMPTSRAPKTWRGVSSTKRHRSGGDAEAVGREAEDARVGLGESDVARGDDVVEQGGDAERLEAGAGAAAGVREEAQADDGAQAAEDRLDLGQDGGVGATDRLPLVQRAVGVGGVEQELEGAQDAIAVALRRRGGRCARPRTRGCRGMRPRGFLRAARPLGRSRRSRPGPPGGRRRRSRRGRRRRGDPRGAGGRGRRGRRGGGAGEGRGTRPDSGPFGGLCYVPVSTSAPR